MRKVLACACVAVGLLQGLPALAADCVDVDLRAEKIAGEPLDHLALYYLVANCGDTGSADIELSLEKDGTLIRKLDLAHVLPAGRGFSHEFLLPILPNVPAGTYRLCLSAALGSASDSVCATVVIDSGGNIVAFTPEQPTSVQERPWGQMKGKYR